MEFIHVLVAGVAAIVLFVFGLESFSSEIEQISGDRFRRFLARATRIPAIGVLIGALVTAIVQSSSATSVIAISLVNAGVLSFKSSLGIIFGANVGTTVTAQLVAFELTDFAPALIIIGFVLSLVRSRVSIFGRSIFYFGFVFFSLNLISGALKPLQHEPAVVEFLAEPQGALLGILVGLLFTALVQSSSVTTGLAIILTQQGLLGLENAVPLIMGANIGTTATALLAVFNMDLSAKKAALSHFMFNVGGVLAFLPVLLIFGSRLSEIEADPAKALAAIHLAFNVGTCVLFLALFRPFANLVERIMGEGKMDFERLDLPTVTPEEGFDEIERGLETNLVALLGFLQENYSAVTLSIESGYRSITEVSARRLEYVGFLEREYLGYFARVVAAVEDEDQSKRLLSQIERFDYLFQIHDSIADLFKARRIMSDHYIELKSDVLLQVRELSSATLALFDEIHEAQVAGRPPRTVEQESELRAVLAEVNRALLPLLADREREDAGALSNLVTYTRRLADKLSSFARLSAGETIAGALPTADQ